MPAVNDAGFRSGLVVQGGAVKKLTLKFIRR